MQGTGRCGQGEQAGWVCGATGGRATCTSRVHAPFSAPCPIPSAPCTLLQHCPVGQHAPPQLVKPLEAQQRPALASTQAGVVPLQAMEPQQTVPDAQLPAQHRFWFALGQQAPLQHAAPAQLEHGGGGGGGGGGGAATHVLGLTHVSVDWQQEPPHFCWPTVQITMSLRSLVAVALRGARGVQRVVLS